jgi:Trypsin
MFPLGDVQVFAPETLINHPEFLETKTYSDIALLKMATPIVLSSKAQTARLPGYDFPPPAVGSVCEVAGFGWTNIPELDKPHNARLRTTKIRILENDICAKFWKVRVNGRTEQLNMDRLICGRAVDENSAPFNVRIIDIFLRLNFILGILSG